MAAVRSFDGLILTRIGVGVFESPCFPANSRILVTWFPRIERARANGVYSVGMYFGIAFLSPLLFWIAAHWGWRALFLLVGAIGVGFGFVWYALYRDPRQSRWVNAEELRYIETGGALTAGPATTAASWRDIGSLLSHRQILGPSIGQFAANSTLVFFLTWFPTYLATERHMSWVKAGVYAMLPFIAASIGVLVGGIVSDALVRRTGSATFGRKAPIVTGLLLASLIVLAAFIESDVLVITIMSIAFFGQGMSNLGWTLIAEVAPANRVGLTAGVFNLCTNVAGIVTPLVIGFVVAATGSFYGGLAFIGGVALIGAFSYAFVLGPVTRME
jgi:ACS family D-galactonate transporter-like MFS transporter